MFELEFKKSEIFESTRANYNCYHQFHGLETLLGKTQGKSSIRLQTKFTAKADVVHPRKLQDPARGARKLKHSAAGVATTFNPEHIGLTREKQVSEIGKIVSI